MDNATVEEFKELAARVLADDSLDCEDKREFLSDSLEKLLYATSRQILSSTQMSGYCRVIGHYQHLHDTIR